MREFLTKKSSYQHLVDKIFFTLLLVLILLPCLANSQSTITGTGTFSSTTTTSSTASITSASLEYEGIFGIGWGVFAIILAIIAGLICCVFGISTVYPGVFIAIGFCIPFVMFIFMAFSPLEQPGNLNLKDNTATNSYVAVKWFFFTIMLLSLLSVLFVYLSLWRSMLIPQRVDSRAQREYFQKYEKAMEDQLKLKSEQMAKKEGLPSNEMKQINPNPENMNESRLDINKNIENEINRVILNNNANQPNENETLGLINNQNNNDLNDKKKKILGGMLKRRRNNEIK
jgi:hypothetical protein